MILTILIFLIVLSLLVFVHELGHFIMAKRSGMKVYEFGFGFPPRVVGLQKVNGKWKVVGRKSEDKDSTIYSINAIPLGGFVKIMGEDAEAHDDPQSFSTKSFWSRLGPLAAGVIMNVLLAWVLLSVGYMYGLPIAVQDIADVPKNSTFTDQRVAIVDVREGSPAEAAGLLPSDIIKTVNGEQITQVGDLQQFIQARKGQELVFTVQRVNEEKTVTVQTPAEPQGNNGIVGIGLATYGKLKFNPVYAVWQGAQTTYHQLTGIVTGLIDVFSSGDGLKSLGGPVKIAQLTGQVADLGLIPLIQFAAFLSLNLAILNTLPFPALDGGRMLFLIIEKVRGKKNNVTVEQYANVIGFMVLLALMLVITARDVWQLETIKQLFS